MRPSAFPVLLALAQMKQQVLLPLSLGGAGGAPEARSADWSERSLVQPGDLRANPDFVQWIRNYNRMSVHFPHTRVRWPSACALHSAVRGPSRCLALRVDSTTHCCLPFESVVGRM